MTTKPKTSVSMPKPRGRSARATGAKLATPRVQRQIRRQNRPVIDGERSKANPALASTDNQGDTAISKPPRETRVQQVLTLLSRPDGASLAEIQELTGWQAHSARGFLSGVIRKLADVELTSNKPTDGPRRYSIIARPQGCEAAQS